MVTFPQGRDQMFYQIPYGTGQYFQSGLHG